MSRLREGLRVEPKHESKLDEVIFQISKVTASEEAALERKRKAKKQAKRSRKINRKK